MRARSRLNSLFAGYGSQIYNVIMPRLINPLYKYVALDVAGTLTHGNVLDVGAGTGDLAIQIVHQQPSLKVTGIDISPDMVEIARTKAARAGLGQRITFETQDISRLPYTDETYDAVVTTISTHHWEDLTNGITECSRVLKKGGVLWIYEFSLVRHTRTGKTLRRAMREIGNAVEVRSIRVNKFPITLFVKYSAQRSDDQRCYRGSR